MRYKNIKKQVTKKIEKVFQIFMLILYTSEYIFLIVSLYNYVIDYLYCDTIQYNSMYMDPNYVPEQRLVFARIRICKTAEKFQHFCFCYLSLFCNELSYFSFYIAGRDVTRGQCTVSW